jgi:MFS family permease
MMTALCGFARGFHELLLARMGVGVTEASLGPTAHSLLADGFDRTRLPLAMSIYGMATSLGSGIAFVLGGQIVTATERIGTVSLPVIGPTASWHLAFLIVAVPGFLLSAVVLAIMREPARSAMVSVSPTTAEAGKRVSMIAFFIRRRALCTVGLLAMCLKTASGYAILSWTPTFLQRTFEWTAAEAGLAIGGLVLTCGIPGAILCGAAATALVRRGVADGALLVIAMSTLISAPFMTLAFLAPTPELTLGLLVIPNLLNPAYVGLWPAMMQAVAPGELRGRISAVSMLTTTLFGMTVGPLAVAILTQYVLRDELAIGTAIAVTTGSLSLVGALALLTVRGTFADALNIAKSWQTSSSKVS